MKTILKLTALIAILLILAGGLVCCKSEPKLFLEVEPTTITVTAIWDNIRQPIWINIRSNSEWVASVENNSWCRFGIPSLSYTTVTGVNNGSLQLNISNLIPLTPRSATIKITSGKLTRVVNIYQEAYIPLGDIPCTNEDCGCGIENPVENLLWLKDIIQTISSDSNTSLLAIWRLQYRGRDVYRFRSPLVFYLDCAGNCIHFFFTYNCGACALLGGYTKHVLVEPYYDFLSSYEGQFQDENNLIYPTN